MMHPEAVRGVEFPCVVRGQGHRGLAAAMVAVAEGDHVEIPRAGPRHEEREVVGLGAGVHKIADFEISRHPGSQCPGIPRDVRMQIDRGRVLQGFILAIGRGHDVRVTMPHTHGDDAPEAIQIPSAFFVEEVLPAPGHDHQGLAVIMKKRRIHEFPPELQDLPEGRAGVWRRLKILDPKPSAGNDGPHQGLDVCSKNAEGRPRQDRKGNPVGSSRSRIQGHRRKHDQIPKQNGQNRLPPVHPLGNQSAGKLTGGNANRHADPQGGNVPLSPSAGPPGRPEPDPCSTRWEQR